MVRSLTYRTFQLRYSDFGDGDSALMPSALVKGKPNAFLQIHHLAADQLRRRMNNELNFHPNFERLVLGCIDADFCKSILVGKLLTRSTRFTYFCTAQALKFRNNSSINL